jgi:hypothetical protein
MENDVLSRPPPDAISAGLTFGAKPENGRVPRRRMRAARADDDVRAGRILPPQPAERREDLLGAPALAEQHTSVLLKDAGVQNLAAHRAELLTDD